MTVTTTQGTTTRAARHEHGGAARSTRFLARARDAAARHGLPPTAPRTLGTTIGADLLVAGDGRGGSRPVVPGPAAPSVTSWAGGPPLVVRGGDDRGPGPRRPVVLGVGSGGASGPALAFAVEAARRDGAGLVVVSAWDRPETMMAVPGVDDVARHARSRARQAVAGARAAALEACPDLEVSARTVEGRAPQVLAAVSARAGLLVVGARPLGRAGRLLPGSVSRRTLRLAPCPVAVVRSPGRRHDGGGRPG